MNIIVHIFFLRFWKGLGAGRVEEGGGGGGGGGGEERAQLRIDTTGNITGKTDTMLDNTDNTVLMAAALAMKLVKVTPCLTTLTKLLTLLCSWLQH